MGDYTQTITVKCTPQACMDALTLHIAQWWSARVEGSAATQGAQFSVHFDKTFKTMRVDELAPHRVVWTCVDSYLDLDSLKNKSEWNATRIEWQIMPADNHIVLSVTHVGLNPSIGCYDACEKGWDHFVTNSLIPFLQSGKGQPYTAA